MKLINLFWCFIPYYGKAVRFRLCLRMREFFRIHKFIFLATCLKNYMQTKYGCELGIDAIISTKAEFMHTVGVVIGNGVVIHDGVKIYSSVVCGRKDINVENDYPTIMQNAVLCTGVKVLGKITIGENVVIAASSVVLADCHEGTWGGIPAKLLKSNIGHNYNMT